MKHYAIIVAGGSGARFGSSIPKQFLPLCGRPVPVSYTHLTLPTSITV